MSDKEIIKALEGNILNAKSVDCKVWSIELNKIENALNLINRQKAEIERLEKELMKCKLEKEMLYNLGTEIKTVAIKEFAERLKQQLNNLEYHENTDRKTVTKAKLYHVVNWVMREVVPEEINNLVKEMMEVQE